MKTLQIIGSFAIGALLAVTLFVFNTRPIEQKLGSVSINSEYHATSTLLADTAGLYQITTVSNSLAGTLGSVTIVSSSNAGGFTVYDADSVTSTPTTTIAVFPANATVGTYTFDVALYQGLKILVPASFNGSFVTTYR